jgi:hypothetical protein
MSVDDLLFSAPESPFLGTLHHSSLDINTTLLTFKKTFYFTMSIIGHCNCEAVSVELKVGEKKLSSMTCYW